MGFEKLGLCFPFHCPHAGRGWFPAGLGESGPLLAAVGWLCHMVGAIFSGQLGCCYSHSSASPHIFFHCLLLVGPCRGFSHALLLGLVSAALLRGQGWQLSLWLTKRAPTFPGGALEVLSEPFPMHSLTTGSCMVHRSFRCPCPCPPTRARWLWKGRH